MDGCDEERPVKQSKVDPPPADGSIACDGGSAASPAMQGDQSQSAQIAEREGTADRAEPTGAGNSAGASGNAGPPGDGTARRSSRLNGCRKAVQSLHTTAADMLSESGKAGMASSAAASAAHEAPRPTKKMRLRRVQNREEDPSTDMGESGIVEGSAEFNAENGKASSKRRRSAEEETALTIKPSHRRIRGKSPGPQREGDAKASEPKAPSAESVDTRVEPPAADKNREAEAKVDVLEAAEPEQRWFTVVKPLHLEMNLKVGNVYSEQALRQRCHGEKKLQKLERFFEDPTYLSPAERPAKKENGIRSPRADRCSPAKPVKFIIGQVVWNMSVQPPRAARITAIADGREDPYLTRFLDAKGAEDGSDGEVFLGSQSMKAFAMRDVLKMHSQTLKASELNKVDALYGRPGPRPAGKFEVGQVVWVSGDSGLPPWPAEVVGGPADPADKSYRLHLLGKNAGAAEITVAVQHLVAFAKGDALALSVAADHAETAHARFQKNGSSVVDGEGDSELLE
eukprot:gnl/TRDRNA2_/TRDRNA2_81591_c0_seq1.p1 gnl/TRDRNA2_/TRDRNA2_81591_c0~~gnl/TRDRNA2_/TRDRNA2_81591_c0_seq1.p1  ORF type:complete len:513 (+),score=107.72 gnl/TRDRNA2_/TRDRNA2_81591_c0_seq1:56-1594(+)